jgi:hypothetical protein
MVERVFRLRVSVRTGETPVPLASLLFLLKFILDKVRRLTLIAKKGNDAHSASAWYTLRAGEGKTQINQAQFRAKTAVPVVVKEGETEAANSRAEATGSAQATVAGAIRENWLGEEEAEAAETGGGSGKECLAAQQPVFLPQ